MIILKVENASVSYDGYDVVSNVSFDLEEGDFLAVVGENGSGKSTLVKALLGLALLSAGSVSLLGGLCRGDIGYLPQQSQAQKDFPASVEEVVLSGCAASLGRLPFYTKSCRSVADKCMEELSVINMRKHSYRDLSGGQQQRVLLARALCAAKKLLVLDEPASGLDPVISSEFASVLLSLNRKRALTTIMVSHNIKFAAENAGKILHMGRGALFFGTSEDYLKSDIGRKFAEYDCYNH